MKLSRKLAWLVLALTALMLWSAAIRHVYDGGKQLGWLATPLRAFASFPSTVKQALSQATLVPITYLPTPADFRPVQRLDTPLWVLRSRYQGEQWEVVMQDLSSGEVRRSWPIMGEAEARLRAEPSSLLLHSFRPAPDELIVSNHRGSLVRLDAEGEMIWCYDSMGTHHSLNPDAEGYLWTPAMERNEAGEYLPRHYTIGNEIRPYLDESLLALDPATGTTHYRASLTELLAANGLLSVIDRAANPVDPFHLNDIEPALYDSEYFQQGDVFVSLCTSSTILHIRPRTGHVLRVIRGPFSFQHDVDILSDHEISLFDNGRAEGDFLEWHHNLLMGGSQLTFAPDAPLRLRDTARHSRLLIYDLATGRFRAPLDSVFRRQQIFTPYGGLAERLPGGDWLVEEADEAIYWVLNQDGVRLKRMVPTPLAGYHHYASWVRVVADPTQADWPVVSGRPSH